MDKKRIIKRKISSFGKYIEYLGNSVDAELERQLLNLLLQGEKVIYLDIGCYDGKKTMGRARRIGTKNIKGIDLPTIGARIARKRGVEVVYADLDKKWPLKSNSIDCITATEVIEHMADTDNFLTEVTRVLKPGGTVIITTDNLAGYHNIFALILGNQPYTGPFLSRIYPIGHRPFAKYYTNKSYSQMRPHLNVMTARALRQLLTYYGFEIVNQGGAGMYPLPPFIANIAALIDKNHASHTLFSARLINKK